MLLHIPEVLTADQVRAFRDALGRAEWIDGRATVGEQGSRVKLNRQVAEHSPIGQQLGRTILDALARHPTFFAAALPLRTSPPLFNRYAGGEHYGLHIDGAMRALAGSDRPMRTDVSSTLFLSDPDDYDGGELVVHDTYGLHEVKLPAGYMVVYPATSMHSVNPVTRGSRWGSFFWAQSMVKDDGLRTMLYDLDVAIIATRQQLGDDNPAVLGLVNHYHNLIRRWAEL